MTFHSTGRTEIDISALGFEDATVPMNSRRAVLLLAASFIYAVMMEGGTGLAQTWSITSAPATNWVCLAASADGSRLLAAANGAQNTNGVLYLSIDSGTSWVPTLATNFAWASIAISADGNRFAAAPVSGSIFTSTDGGATWSTNGNPARNWSHLVSSANGSRLAATFLSSQVFISTNAGGTWTTSVASNVDLIAVSSSADGSKLVVGNNVGHINTSTNGGVTWSIKTSIIGTVNCLASSADGTHLLAGIGNPLVPLSTGALYTSTNFGATWISNSVPPNNWSSVASSADGKTLLAVSGANIYTSSNGGASWVPKNLAPSMTWRCAAVSADGGKWYAAANPGGIYVLPQQPAPQISAAAADTNLTLSWTLASTNFAVQQTPDLTGNIWFTLTNQPATDFTNLQEQIQVPTSDTAGYFRLIAQ